MSKTYSKTRTLVECALMIALGTVLANIKIFEMPNGGSITLLSMLPFILVSYRHGTKWGLFTGFVNSLLQMLLGFYAPPAPGLLPLVGMILLAYVLAFTTAGGSHRLHYPKPARGKSFAVGDTVTLYYDPDAPEKMYVEGDRATLGAEVLYAVLGVVLLVLTVGIAR